MTFREKASVHEILSWLKEHQSFDHASFDDVAEQFGLTHDQLLTKLQWLQRYECVKRGGSATAAWSITQQGVVRLAEGRFSKGGSFLSQYQASPSSAIKLPNAVEKARLDAERPVSTSSTIEWLEPLDERSPRDSSLVPWLSGDSFSNSGH